MSLKNYTVLFEMCFFFNLHISILFLLSCDKIKKRISFKRQSMHLENSSLKGAVKTFVHQSSSRQKYDL